MTDLTSLIQAIWPTVLFSLGVYGLLFVLRLIVERSIPRLKMDGNYYWREVVLPVLPFLLGGLVGALLSAYPYPEGIGSCMARALYGAVCGLFSGVVYRVVKNLVRSKLSKSEPPPP